MRQAEIPVQLDFFVKCQAAFYYRQRRELVRAKNYHPCTLEAFEFSKCSFFRLFDPQLLDGQNRHPALIKYWSPTRNMYSKIFCVLPAHEIMTEIAYCSLLACDDISRPKITIFSVLVCIRVEFVLF